MPDHITIKPHMNDRTFQMYLEEGRRLSAPAYQTKRPIFTDDEGNPLPADEQTRRWEKVKPVGSNA